MAGTRNSAEDRSNMNKTYKPTATFSSNPLSQLRPIHEITPTKKPTLKDQLKPISEKPKATPSAKPKPTPTPTPKRPMVGNDKEFNKKYGDKSWNNGYTN